MFCCTPPLSPQTLPPPSITTTTIQKYIVCGFFVFNNHHNSSQKQNSPFVSFVFEGGVWSFRFSSVLVLTTDFHEIQNTTVFICCSNKKSKQNIQKPHNRQKSADVFPQQTKRDTESERVYKIKLACPILNSNVLSIQNRDDNVRVANIPT